MHVKPNRETYALHADDGQEQLDAAKMGVGEGLAREYAIGTEFDVVAWDDGKVLEVQHYRVERSVTNKWNNPVLIGATGVFQDV